MPAHTPGPTGPGPYVRRRAAAARRVAQRVGAAAGGRARRLGRTLAELQECGRDGVHPPVLLVREARAAVHPVGRQPHGRGHLPGAAAIADRWNRRRAPSFLFVVASALFVIATATSICCSLHHHAFRPRGLTCAPSEHAELEKGGAEYLQTPARRGFGRPMGEGLEGSGVALTGAPRRRSSSASLFAAPSAHSANIEAAPAKCLLRLGFYSRGRPNPFSFSWNLFLARENSITSLV